MILSQKSDALILLELSAHPKLKNNEDKNAYDLVVEQKHKDVAEVINPERAKREAKQGPRKRVDFQGCL